MNKTLNDVMNDLDTREVTECVFNDSAFGTVDIVVFGITNMSMQPSVMFRAKSFKTNRRKTFDRLHEALEFIGLEWEK